MRVVTIEAADVRQSRFLEEYGRQHAPAKGKRHTPVSWRVTEERGGVAGVTLEEVINRARALYPDLKLSQAAARTWVARDLLPEPDIEYLGQGKGTRAHYSDGSPAQMAAAAFTASQGYTQKQIAQARRVVLEGVPLEGLMVDVAALLETGRVPGESVRIPPARVAAIAEAVQRYAIALATARSGRNVTRPLPACLHKRRWTEDGKPMFSYFASALGYYIDPRGKDDITGLAADLDQQTRQKREEIRRNRNTDV